MQLSGQWPAFIVESHHVRYEDDSVMLGEELLKNADKPPQEEPLEGQAGAGAPLEGQAGAAPVGEGQAGAAAPPQGQAGAAPVGDGQAGAGAAVMGQAGAAAEGGQVGVEGGEEDRDALDFDGVGPPERKSRRLIFQQTN